MGPVARIVGRAGREWREAHYSDIRSDNLKGVEGIILCGTALKDNLFATRIQEFSWLKTISVPVLGICAGMQILCMVFGGAIHPGGEIGMTTIRADPTDPFLCRNTDFEVYELHSFTCEPPPGWVVMAESDACIQAIRHPNKPLYGVMFHPEVRNDWVVERFLSLSQKKDA
ncbi:MAG: glutamine amidotransferase [Methanoregulaceae archaeon]|nr:glutamine amidotransferase [Methanoregulaceae archaeon]